MFVLFLVWKSGSPCGSVRCVSLFLMANGRAVARRSGIIRPGPAERARLAAIREREKERQRQCRRRGQEANAQLQAEELLYAQNERRVEERCCVSREVLNRREVRRDAMLILDCVTSTLAKTPDRHHKEAVLQAVWSSHVTKVSLPISRRMSEQAKTHDAIVNGLAQSLSEVKSAKTSAQLVAKHAILTAVVSSGASGSARQTAHTLKVHHCNVIKAVQRRAMMTSGERVLWTLSVQKRRSDATSDAVRNIVIAWWNAETRPSPNRKEVVRQWIAPGVYESHHTQYLLESQA